MKTTMQKAKLLALILMGTTAIAAGCSSFKSPSAEYVKPGELCTDVSALPDPNAPPKKETDPLKTLASQYGIGGRRDESPERLLMQAETYFEQKRFHDSARLYKKYLALVDVSTLSPDLLGQIHYRIGYVAAKKTFHTEAKGEFAQALQFAPLNNEYLFGYAKACYDSGDYQEADKQFVALLGRDPGYPEANKYYGMTLLEGSNRANALQPLTTAVGALEATRLLADKYYQVGELELAAQMEAQAIQLAAQSAQPVPKFPHKEQLLINAQNATYAQTLNTMNAAHTANASAPFVSQYAQPGPTIAPSVAPAPAVAPQSAVAIPEQNAASAPNVNLNVPATTELPQNNAPQFNSTIPVVPPVDPIGDANVADAPSQYASVAPVPVAAAPTTTQSIPSQTGVVESEALQGQFPAFVAPQSPNEGGVQEPEIDVPTFDELEEWDESAFATSGSGYLPAPGAASVPQTEPTTTEEPSPVVPTTPSEFEEQQREDAPQYQSVQPTFTRGATAEETFAFAESRFESLETVERIAFDAQTLTQTLAENSHRGARPKLVGYLAPSMLEKQQTALVPIHSDAAVEEQPVSMVVTKLPPSSPQSNVSIRYDENFTEAVQNDGVKSRKRTIKTNVDVGRGNPGLFVSTAATKSVDVAAVFRPGSIAESDDDVDQSRPDEFAIRFARQAKRRDSNVANAKNREEEWAKLLECADALEEGYAFVDQNALAYYAPIYLEPADEEYVELESEEWDESAFATSGAPRQSEPVAAPTNGGFGDYAPPTNGFGDYAPPSDGFATATEPVYVAQLAESAAPQTPLNVVPTQQIPFQQAPIQQAPVQQIPTQQVPVQQIPFQQVPVPQFPAQQVPVQQAPMQQIPAQQVQVQTPQSPIQNFQTRQFSDRQSLNLTAPNQGIPAQPIMAQQVPAQQTAVQSLPVAQPTTSTRSQTTPEQRLEAARLAGAEVVELSPDQYRRAVTAGLGTQPSR